MTKSTIPNRQNLNTTLKAALSATRAYTMKTTAKNEKNLQREFTDESFRAYFVIKNGLQHEHCMWAKTKPKCFSGMVCSMHRCSDRLISLFCNVAIKDETIDFNLDLTTDNKDCDIRPATKQEIEEFTKKLADLNLEIRDVIDEKKEYDVYKREEYIRATKRTKFMFKDVKKVLFKYRGELLTADEVRNLKIASNEAFLYSYDNGYSYMGTEPTNVDKWLSTVFSTISKEEVFDATRHGFTMRLSKEGTFTVDVLIGKNEHWSEVSFS